MKTALIILAVIAVAAFVVFFLPFTALYLGAK